MNNVDFQIPRKGKAKVGFQLTVPFVTRTVETNGQIEIPSPLEVHSVSKPGTPGCKDSIGFDTCVVLIPAFPYNESGMYESDLWKEPHYINIYHRDTDRYEIDPNHIMQLKTKKTGDGFWNDVSHQNVTVNIICTYVKIVLLEELSFLKIL